MKAKFLKFINSLKGQKVVVVSFLALIILICIALYLMDFNPTQINYKCQIKAVTGFSCLGCGGTRAIENLFHLNFLDAFLYNPFLVIAIVIFIIIIFKFLYTLFIKKTTIKPKEFTPLQGLIFAFIIIFCMIIRNTPFYLEWFYV